MRRRLWSWPIFVVLLLLVSGWWGLRRLESSTRQLVGTNLQTVLNADITALRLWVEHETSMVSVAANDPQVRDTIVEMNRNWSRNPEDSKSSDWLRDPLLGKLADALIPWQLEFGHDGYLVYDAEGRVLAANLEELVGRERIAGHESYLLPAMGGESTLSRPFPSAVLLPDGLGGVRAGMPTMFVATPVRDEAGSVAAVLAFRLDPKREFSEILTVARPGESGETYAFDRQGVMISASRFESQLRDLSLMSDGEGATSMLSVEIRDPGVDLTRGGRATLRRNKQPWTEMATSAIAGEAGQNLRGYRDYRGVPVVGAWQWLSDMDMGVATELDLAEAYRPMQVVRTSYAILMSILVGLGIASQVWLVLASRWQQAAYRAVAEAKTLGQYALDEQIGEGGMGVVYRAHHALLQRPTAVKLLREDKVDEATVRRFEREVRTTSKLGHPNTVAIYDYGRTPEGVFYYAMEYLPGMTLDRMVERFGPLPERRAIHLLRQVCGSLNEAHQMGLVHRDIKPSNIMVTYVGGLYDLAKVLDFGLVKSCDEPENSHLTMVGTVVGTPYYISPEALERPSEMDARSDIYSLGVVAYFLLTGRPAFEGESTMEICKKHLCENPLPLSAAAGRTIHPDLEVLLLRCLAKDPRDRPQTVRQLMRELDDCEAAFEWTDQDAELWWSTNVLHRSQDHSETSTIRVAGDVTGVLDTKTENA